MQKFLRQTFGQLTESDLQKVEREFGELPLIYKEFLLRQNGGIAHLRQGGVFLFYGIYDGPNDLRSILREQQNMVDASAMIPIGEDSNGDYLLLSKLNGRIFSTHNEGTEFIEFIGRYCLQVEEESPVIEAIQCQRIDLIAALLDQGRVEVNSRAKFDYNLIQYAVFLGNQDVVEFLAKNGARADGCLAILFTVGKPTRPLIKVLLENGASVNEHMPDGKPVLELDSPWIKHVLEINAAIHATQSLDRTLRNNKGA